MNAYCGLDCSKCPTYLATQKNEPAEREKVAGQWSQFFGMTLTQQDINCDGCQSGSKRLFMHCKSCQIRDCCQSKDISTCAECDDCPCDSLNNFFAIMPAAKSNIEAIQSTK